MELAGRIALITGGGRGIGKATALLLAREGADIAIAALEQNEADATAEEVRTLGHRAISGAVDVRLADQVNAFVRRTIQELGPIDVLVNNAGVMFAEPVKDMDENLWDRTLDTNLKGVFLCTKAVLPGMLRRNQGRIINISSGLGRSAYMPYITAYAASKFGVIGFTQSLAAELKGQHIQVNAICPPALNTNLAQGHLAQLEAKGLATPEEVAERRSRFGDPATVAWAVLFLASKAAEGISGEALSPAEWAEREALLRGAS